MATTTKSRKTAKSAAKKPAESFEDLTRIRDIIFGPMMRDYDKRFRRLENAFTKLGKELKEWADGLEAKIASQQKKSRDEMIEAIRKVDSRADKTEKQAEQRSESLLKRLEGDRERLLGKVTEAKTQFTNRLAKESAKLSEAANAIYEELSAAIEEVGSDAATQIEELDHAKPNRFSLGEALIALGNNVKNGAGKKAKRG